METVDVNYALAEGIEPPAINYLVFELCLSQMVSNSSRDEYGPLADSNVTRSDCEK